MYDRILFAHLFVFFVPTYLIILFLFLFPSLYFDLRPVSFVRSALFIWKRRRGSIMGDDVGTVEFDVWMVGTNWMRDGGVDGGSGDEDGDG